MYEHLNLKAWPFHVAADPEFAEVWAGRRETREQIKQLIWKMQFASRSGLHLLWANLGMGKSHTLYHIRYLCEKTKTRLIPVYVVMPKRATGFLELYRAIATELPFEFLGEKLASAGVVSASNPIGHHIFSKSPGIVSAIIAMLSGDAEKNMAARQWLSAQPGLSSRDLHSVGVTYRIKTPEDAINALTALTRLVTLKSDPPSKLVIMIDEFQRIGELKESVRREISSGLHSYFNENPNGLEVILTFSFGREDNVSFLLSGELKSRSEPQTISLDVLSEAEAIEFLRDLLEQFRIEKDARWAFPFSPASIKALVSGVSKTKPITPRRLMMYADHVLTQSQYAHGQDYRDEITESEVRELLADPRLGMMDTETGDTSG